MATRRPKEIVPVQFVSDDTAPSLARAASLALAVARHCKTTTWAEFAERLKNRDADLMHHLAEIDISRTDSDLIKTHDHVLRLLKVKPLVTLAVCPDCGGWVLVATGQAPTKCLTRQQCPGKPVKASIASKRKPETKD